MCSGRAAFNNSIQGTGRACVGKSSWPIRVFGPRISFLAPIAKLDEDPATWEALCEHTFQVAETRYANNIQQPTHLEVCILAVAASAASLYDTVRYSGRDLRTRLFCVQDKEPGHPAPELQRQLIPQAASGSQQAHVMFCSESHQPIQG